MIKFEEHDNQLFRMLDKPVPLTPDAEMPCLVRLIQDETQMGKYNNDMNCWDIIKDMLWITRNIKENPFYSNTLSCKSKHAYEKDSNGQDSCIASIHQLEIIGYPVADGSRWWALYSAMNGKSLVHKDAKQCRIFTMFSEKELRVSDGEGETVEYVEIDEFLNDAAKDGWQLYEPEPKPLLADTKVGDLCRLKNGYWTQIKNIAYWGGFDYVCENGHSYTVNGVHNITSPDIAYWESLAPEGTAEWAWQMLNLLRLPVYHPAEGVLRIPIGCDVKGFVRSYAKTGWQLYKEPEPQYKVGDWVEWCGDQYMVESAPPQSGGRYNIRSPYDELGCSVCPENITRKLSPTDIVIHIGCLSGTVSFVDADRFILRGIGNSEMSNACIMFKMLDTRTRELVESLLEAMQEVKK